MEPTRPRRIARRLYLSVLALFVAFGVLVTGGMAIREAHDHIVTRRAFDCFEPLAGAWADSFAPGADRSDTRGLVAAEVACGVEFLNWSQDYAAKAAWANGYRRANRWEVMGFASLSFVPAVALFAAAAWARWLVR